MYPNQSRSAWRRSAVVLVAALAAWSLQAEARADTERPRPAAHKDELGRRPHGPPPEAFDACSDKSEGDACSVEFHEHTLTGSCAPAREQDALFCLPDELPPPPPGGELPPR